MFRDGYDHLYMSKKRKSMKIVEETRRMNLYLIAITLDFQKSNIKYKLRLSRFFPSFFFNHKMISAADIERPRPQLVFKYGLEKNIFLERRHI